MIFCFKKAIYRCATLHLQNCHGLHWWRIGNYTGYRIGKTYESNVVQNPKHGQFTLQAVLWVFLSVAEVDRAGRTLQHSFRPGFYNTVSFLLNSTGQRIGIVSDSNRREGSTVQ